jgi:DNA-binding beta-propeller fold protein YncE
MGTGRKTLALWCALAVSTGVAGESRGAALLYSLWGNDSVNSIVRRDIDTNASYTLRTGSGGNVGPEPHWFAPEGMTVDPVNQQLYYANSNSGTIERINYNGTGHTTIVTSAGSIEDVAVDLVRRKVYWVDSYNDRVVRADLDGGTNQNVTPLVTTGLIQPSGIALDIATGRVYWADYHADVIGSVNGDGTSPTTFATPGDGPKDVAVDSVNHKLIWTDFGSHKLHGSDMNGNNKVVLVNGTFGANNPGALTLDETNGYMYWIDWYQGTIRRAGLDGSNSITVHTQTGLSSLSGLAWDPSPIPEPATGVAVLALGAALSYRRGRRRRAPKASETRANVATADAGSGIANIEIGPSSL